MFEEFRVQFAKDVTLCFDLQPLGHRELSNWVLPQQSGDSSFLPVFAFCRLCSKSKKQFNTKVNTEARQCLGVGLGRPKLGFSIHN